MTALVPSPAQDAIIRNEDGHRIRLVSAVPGSGKTWVVARAIEHEVQGRPDQHPGIAALSFTNVAKNEVSAALGGTIPSQHFVGTLDSFLYRFVLRPFLPAFVDADVVWRVVPDSLTRSLKADPFLHKVWRNKKVYTTLNVFDCALTKNGITANHPKTGAPLELTDDEAKAVRKAKKQVWFKYGLMSHSDASYLAAHMLESDHGAAIRHLVVTRFPFLVVDELQDTGESHSRCLRSVLADERCTALLVGDPDQSIYEFSGASPTTFAEFGVISGAFNLGLPESRRCPTAVCGVVSALSTIGRTVKPLEDAPAGRAILVIHSDDHDENAAFLASLPATARVLVRKNATRAALIGSTTAASPDFKSQPITALPCIGPSGL